jgi:hypothetical protein
MIDGVTEYLWLSLGVGFLAHAPSRNFFKCAIAGSLISSILNLIHESWLANWEVNPGWLPALLILGMGIAFPACVVAGIPWIMFCWLWTKPAGI